jgi:hypothetical protein
MVGTAYGLYCCSEQPQMDFEEFADDEPQIAAPPKVSAAVAAAV